MTFQYEPLSREPGAIRLVTIEPSADRDAAIRCSIRAGSLNSDAYDALSYTWGSPEDRATISLDGHDFSVTRNLHDALRDIRDATEKVQIWIDALCINQSDIAECNHQVRQMADVYKNTKRVFIWMGPDIPEFEDAIDLMNWLKQCTSNPLLGVGGMASFAESKHRKEGWAALTELVQRPWWNRVWIVQEAVYGRDPVVVVGKDRFEWELLQVLGDTRNLLIQVTWSLLNHNKRFYSGDFVHASSRLQFICELRKACPLGPQALDAVLLGVRASEATNPRDKVFAMLGLLKDDATLCEVDYGKSIGQVYAEAAFGIYKLTGSLRFLSWTSNELSSNRGRLEYTRELPSWVPSWASSSDQPILELQSLRHRAAGTRESPRQPVAPRPPGGMDMELIKAILDSSLNEHDLGRKCIYSASLDSRPFAEYDPTRGCLKAAGYLVDVLESVSPPCTTTFPLDGPPSFWIRTVLNKLLGLPTSEEESDPYDSDDEIELPTQLHPIFWRMILADQWEGRRLRLGPTGTLEMPGLGSVPPRSIEELFEIRRKASSLQHGVAPYRWRRLFVSKRQSMGLVPIDAQPGDAIFVILGCDVPFLLRKANDGPGYRLLGEW